ncbi:MAG: hypothetical protein LQ338_002018 [Usnochroma carphineum]|nr:MAG: hypothetical protein LQ338_002018 [Usnochroma carphineum]
MPQDPRRAVDYVSSGMANMKLGNARPPIITKGPGQSSKWEQLGAVGNSAASPARNTDSDGYTTVASKRPAGKQPALQPGNGNRQQKMTDRVSSIYNPQRKPASHYKQSCLPLEERDPEFVELERNKGSIYPKSAFCPGMIIRGVVHEQDYIAAATGSNLTIQEKHRTSSRYGPICTKVRKMIVLGLFQDHYTAIPLFTHNGNGLDRKARPDEFVSVHDHRARDPGPPLSKHKPLITQRINKGIDPFDPKSTAHVTYALPRKYDLPVVQEGYLTHDSLNYLIGLFRYYAPNKMQDVSLHG